MATIEDASYCPKCSQQGIKVKESPGPKGGKVFVIHCQNEVCLWYQTGWVVQVASDGVTVAERNQGPKQFSPLTPTDKRIAEKLIREVGGNID
jgi:hypothetical protein